MKVAYFLGGLNRGGAESLILDICRQHEKVPFDLVCMYRHDGNMMEEFKASGASLIHVRKQKGYIRYMWSIRKVIKQEQVTIVHSQTPANTLILAIALIGSGIKIMTTLHGYNFGKAPRWKRRIIYAFSEKILCVSNHQKQYYKHLWQLPARNKLQVVYNGIDFSKIEKALPNPESKSNNRIQLAMVGNFVSVRSQKVIVEAIHILKEKGIVGFDFYFIGRRDEKEARRYDECVQYCEEHQLSNVHFLGSRGDVPTLLKSMDGFVYSTAHDTFGIAIIEAIAAGLPIVVNDWPVMKEVCNLGLPETNNVIRFFKTEDIDDCVEKIANLLDDIQNYKRMQTDCLQASEMVKQKYSIDNHIEQLYKVYSSIDN